MDEYKNFLADNILSEDRVITYRFLSRALKVHVNVAKQMLYDFHESQNDKRPGAIHATYLLYGTVPLEKGKSQSEARAGGDGDVEMTSSLPEAEEVAETVPTFTLSLVREEQLKDVLDSYDEVTSIHIYSLGPHPIKDMALLSDAARQVLDLPSLSDPIQSAKTYGTIRNPHVRKRERRTDLDIPAAPPSSNPFNARPVAAKQPEKAPTAPSMPKEGPGAGQQSPPQNAFPSAPAAKKPVPSLKKGGSAGSGIMQSFAKAAAKPKKAQAPTPAVSKPEDSGTQPMSEGEEDDSQVLPQPRAHDGPGRKSRKEREEELRRMMEEDDDDEEKEEEEEEEAEDKAESPAEEPMNEPEPVEEPPAQEAAKEEPAEIISASANGRRRGRRKVMKKKQTLDAQGYLVTVQEPGWESFSEDEAPPPPKPKTSTSAPTAPAKKAAPKVGQGNIMSFFSKK